MISTDPILIRNPSRMSSNMLAARRVSMGIADDQKPSLVRLPNDELILVAFHIHPRHDPMQPFRSETALFRSRDGGETWSPRQVIEVKGIEPYLTVVGEGVILATSHLHAADALNDSGLTHSYLHRSANGGLTWTPLRIDPKFAPGAAPNAITLTSRNALELRDGTILLGVSGGSSHTSLRQSTNSGITWEHRCICQFEDLDTTRLASPLMGEAVLWEAACGDILAICRVDPAEIPGMVPASSLSDYEPRLHDQHDWLLLLRSTDGGCRWRIDQALGSDYGEMYPSILRLHDRRLLLTFTVRSLHPPLGVNAVIGEELPMGFAFDFNNDRFVIDQKTPHDQISGGGYGPTVELKNGTLVTAYSYRGGDEFTQVDSFVALKHRIEVVRWRLP
jgi:hypothetical protein